MRLRILRGAAQGQDAKAAPACEHVLRKRQSIIAIATTVISAIATTAIATTAATKPGPARRQPRAPYKGTAADSKPSQARQLETETSIPRGSLGKCLGGFLKTGLGIERHLLLVDDDWCGAHDLGLGQERRGRRVFLLLATTSTTPSRTAREHGFAQEGAAANELREDAAADQAQAQEHDDDDHQKEGGPDLLRRRGRDARVDIVIGVGEASSTCQHGHECQVYVGWQDVHFLISTMPKTTRVC